MTGPENNELVSRLRVSLAEREQVVGALKTAFVQGRLTEDELGGRASQAYAARTRAELAEVTTDLPAETPASPRHPWRATKIAWRIECALILPGIVTILLLPGGPHVDEAAIITLAVTVYLVFWATGVAMMRAARSARRTRPVSERLHASHTVARDQVLRILGAAQTQGRLTEEEHDTRAARVPASRRQADLDELIADLPAGLAAKPPTARDAWAGAAVTIAAACVLAVIVVAAPDNYLAFALALLAAATLLVAPVMTVGLTADVRQQRRVRR